MEITYNLTREDCRQFNKFLASRSRRRFFNLARIVIIAGLIGTGVAAKRHLSAFWTGVAAVVMAVLYAGYSVFAYNLMLRFRTWRLFAKGDGTLAQQTIRIESDGLHWKTATGADSAPWDSIREIAEDGNCLCFFSSRTAAVVLPKRVFTSSAAASSFGDAARSYWEASRKPIAS